ncbi:MAG: hypothetical protein LIO41_03655 [Ruminococcus sp.]|nr:hypothetical protein [Ruminococcus sp.]
MLRSELERVFKSTKSRLVIAFLFLMPFIDFVQHIYGDIYLYGEYNSCYFSHPVYAAFLSGSSMGNFTQILLFWILPIYFMLLYSDSFITDKKTGYFSCLSARAGRKTYFKTKFLLSFALPFIIVLSTLVINLIMCILLFHGGTMFGGIEDYIDSMEGWTAFGINHQYIYYSVYMITVSFICGVCGALGLCCSILFESHLKAYPCAFFIWFVQILFDHGIGNTVQPYTEYGITYFFSGLLIFLLIFVVVFVITYFVRIKCDEE